MTDATDPPVYSPVVNPNTGMLTEEWLQYFINSKNSINEKASRDLEAALDNLAKFDAFGNPVDGGIEIQDIVTPNSEFTQIVAQLTADTAQEGLTVGNTIQIEFDNQLYLNDDYFTHSITDNPEDIIVLNKGLYLISYSIAWEDTCVAAGNPSHCSLESWLSYDDTPLEHSYAYESETRFTSRPHAPQNNSNAFIHSVDDEQSTLNLNLKLVSDYSALLASDVDTIAGECHIMIQGLQLVISP